jgi:hypothetical protein
VRDKMKVAKPMTLTFPTFFSPEDSDATNNISICIAYRPTSHPQYDHKEDLIRESRSDHNRLRINRVIYPHLFIFPERL